MGKKKVEIPSDFEAKLSEMKKKPTALNLTDLFNEAISPLASFFEILSDADHVENKVCPANIGEVGETLLENSREMMYDGIKALFAKN